MPDLLSPEADSVATDDSSSVSAIAGAAVATTTATSAQEKLEGSSISDGVNVAKSSSAVSWSSGRQLKGAEGREGGGYSGKKRGKRSASSGGNLEVCS